MRLSKGQRNWFLGAFACVALAALAAVLADALLARLSPTLDLSAFGAGVEISERGRATLTDTAGVISVTCVLPAESPAAAPVGRLLRTFAQASRDAAGATLELAYVDPRVDAGAAERLMGQGAEGPGILFRQAGRRVFVHEAALLSALDGTYDPAEADGAITAALARLTRSEGVEVGWLTGHGEPAFDGTDPLTGFSGLRRALENEGCRLRPLALDASAPDGGIPEDLGALLIVSPRYPVTSAERAVLIDWLDQGGRLFCALPPSGDAGLGPLLARWGIRVGDAPRVPARRGEGDAGLTDLLSAKHPVTRELAAADARVTFCAPRALWVEPIRGVAATVLAELDALPPDGADEGPVGVMVAAERGSRVDADLAFRPGRVIAVGEAAFAANRLVLDHASPNRDLAVNAVRWLTGLSGSGARSGAGVLRVGQDARAWRLDFLLAALGVPLALCLVLWLVTRRRE